MRDKFTTQRATLPVDFQQWRDLHAGEHQYLSAIHRHSSSEWPAIYRGSRRGWRSGGEDASKVADLITSLNPNLFLYLGDVYEQGSLAEFYNWYGTSTTFFGQLRAITNPTIGNHEYLTGDAAGYFDYWNNIPNYYSYNAGGWHFISLNSNAVQGSRLARIGPV